MEKPFNGILFRLNGLCCAVDALEIREIVGKTEWKPLSVDGEPGQFIQVRGKAARVVDLREKFGFPEVSKEGWHSYIAVRFPALRQGTGQGGDGDRLAALWVDMVLDLVSVPGENLNESPSSVHEIPAKYVRAIFDHDGEKTYVLKMKELLEKDFSGENEPALEDKAS